MKSIDLLTVKQHIYFFSRVRFLKPDELFYVRVESLENMPETHFDLIKAAAEKSSQVVISIPSKEFEKTELTAKFFELGVKGFALRISHNSQRWQEISGVGQHNSGDFELIHLFERYKYFRPKGKLMIFEFQVQNDDLTDLGPTIADMYKRGLKWSVINVEGYPDDDRAKKYSDFIEYLRIRNCSRFNLYFSFWNEHIKDWDVKTRNTFAGINYVHIDLSNKCTHSCVFCALYGPEASVDIKERSNGVIPEYVTNYMKQEIDRDKCLEIIESLPWSVELIQFGGVGDPLIHPNAPEIIAAARRRGIRVEMLSNMEYLNDEQVQSIHELGGYNFNDLHFIVNLSGATPETYIKTRPRQTEKTFQKVIHNISLFSRLRKANEQFGVNFTLMCVVNNLNCHELFEIAQMAQKIGARKIWFKPMELHLPVHKQFVPAAEQMDVMVDSLKKAIQFSEENGIEVFQKSVCEEIIRRHEKVTT